MGNALVYRGYIIEPCPTGWMYYSENYDGEGDIFYCDSAVECRQEIDEIWADEQEVAA